MTEHVMSNAFFDRDRLRYWRHRRALSQAALAELAGVSVVAVTGWETGKRRPTQATLHKLAGALAVDIEALMDLGEIDVRAA